MTGNSSGQTYIPVTIQTAAVLAFLTHPSRNLNELGYNTSLHVLLWTLRPSKEPLKTGGKHWVAYRQRS